MEALLSNTQERTPLVLSPSFLRLYDTPCRIDIAQLVRKKAYKAILNGSTTNGFSHRTDPDYASHFESWKCMHYLRVDLNTAWIIGLN